MMKKSGIIAILLTLVLLTTACGYIGFGGGSPASGLSPEYQRFHTGTRGIVVRPEYVPSQLFYYSDPGGSGYNEFELSFDVRNKGASYSRGALYISGYDPNLIHFEGVNIGTGILGSCGISISSLSFGSLGGIFSCEGFTIGASDTGNWFVSVDSLQALIQSIGDRFDKDWWDSDKFDFGINTQSFNDEFMFSLNMINPNIDFDYLGHGLLLIGMFAGIDFTRTFGREYLLAGRSPYYPDGEVEYVIFTGMINPMGWAPGLDEIRQSFLMTNCYFYSTHAAPLVCIDPDPRSDHRKVCRPGSMSWSGSQGAPVAITSIEQESSPYGSIFRIHIRNVGGGEVYDPGQLERCSPYLSGRARPQDKNIVYIGQVRIGNRPLINCVPNGIVRLQEGRGTITCEYPHSTTGGTGGIKSAYQTPLVVELWYGYSETQQRDILIRRVS